MKIFSNHTTKWLWVFTICLLMGGWQFAHTILGNIERVSMNSSGNEGNSNSYVPTISEDGRFVAFESEASNLVGNDTNNSFDVFVHDRQTRTITRVSVASNGIEGNGHSFYGRISKNGRFITFFSNASNLVSNDSNGSQDVFVHDLQTRTTTRVSVNSNGFQGNNNSYAPSISSDGRFIAFASFASNLVSGDNNNNADIFVHDQQAGTTTRLSLNQNGNEVYGFSANTSISDDGYFIAFESDAPTLVANDTNNSRDIFVHNRQTGTTTRVSVNSSGFQGNNNSYAPNISSDGRFVAFDSLASNLVNGDNNNAYDVFLRDLQEETTTRLSVNSNGIEGNSGSSRPNLSNDGRFVVFDSFASNLVSNDNNNSFDIFLYDRQTGLISRVSLNSNASEGNGNSFSSKLSGNGRFVTFDSEASNLVGGDNNNSRDIFVIDLLPPTPTPTATRVPEDQMVYLPMISKPVNLYFEGPGEREDNDSLGQANGRLRSGRTYNGHPNDEKDYFFVYLDKTGPISIDLQNYTSSGQLQLFYQSVGNRVAYDTTPPYQLNYHGPAGFYYIYIATTDGFNSTTPYSLRVDY